MRKKGQDVTQVNLAGIRRDIVNLAHNYSSAQKAVRQATSNDPWGPSSTLMAEIADLTYNVVAFTEIMQMLWKRLNDHGKNWRHVFKALVLLEYLIKTGTEKVAQQCKENIFAIQTLQDFQYMEGRKDQGLNVREKAKQLVSLLKDDERLRNERARALKAKERFAQSLTGFGSDGLETISPVSIDFQDREPCSVPKSTSQPELEAARPETVGEEELQLQLALAMSREEAEHEEQLRRNDDVRLQLAISQSQKDFKPRPTENRSHMQDLLDVKLDDSSVTNTPTDPWGMPVGVPTSLKEQPLTSPWCSPATSSDFSPSLDICSPLTSQQMPVTVDPWKVPSQPPLNFEVAPPVDPWAPVPLTQSVNSRIESSPFDDQDEFDDITNRSKIYAKTQSPFDGTNGNRTPSDPFDFKSIGDSIPPSTGAIKKTPHSFLGEHSALVNLDNLLSSSPMRIPTSVPTTTIPYAPNPFAALTPSTRLTTNQEHQDPSSEKTNSTANPFAL